VGHSQRRHQTSTLQAQTPTINLIPLISGEQITWGFWSAVSATSGKILWQTADPTAGAIDTGALSVANGIVYAPSFDSSGHLYALNSSTGQILWSYASGGSVVDGPSIASGNSLVGLGLQTNLAWHRQQ